MLHPDREALACAAGFFNGEGCSTIRRNAPTQGAQRYAKPVLSVKQAGEGSLEVLQTFQHALLGLGRIYGPYDYSGKHPTYKPYYLWQAVNFPQAQAVIAMLWPWLSRVKKDQWRLVLAGLNP